MKIFFKKKSNLTKGNNIPILVKKKQQVRFSYEYSYEKI